MRAIHASLLLVLLFPLSCDGLGPDRVFCLKVYRQGEAPPAACNGRPSSDSYTPTLKAPNLKRGVSPPITYVLEVVVESGSGGQANYYGVRSPKLPSGEEIGLTVTPSATRTEMPGGITVTIQSPAGGFTGVIPLKWTVEDDDTEREQEVVVEISFT
jgi:hypothetical protein